MMEMPNLQYRCSKIRIVMMDMDGVLTDGHIVYGDYGDEIKNYDVQDGFGIHMLQLSGIKTMIVTSRKCRTNARRAKELKMSLFQNISDKYDFYLKLQKKLKFFSEEVCFIGDDWVDGAVMRQVGLGVAVNNAVDEVKAIAHYVTKRDGGHGAVREVAQLILAGQNKLDTLKKKYLERA